MDSTDECGGKGEIQPKCHRNSPSFIDRITIDVRCVKGVRNVELLNAPRNLSSSPSVDRETIIMTWQQGDPDDPHNWSTVKKTWIFITLMLIILNSCIGSSLTSNGISFIVSEFGVKSQPQRVLPISVYLIGYVFGPIVWAPLSEQFGRQDITIGTFVLFVLFTMACALAPSWPVLLIFRLLSGIFASAPIAVVTGILADIYQDSTTRGRSIAVYMIITAFAPLIAPILSGFVSPTLGWRWSFWIALMFAGCTLVPLVVLPETNAAVLLRRRATKLHGSERSLSKLRGLENCGSKISITTLLMRPLHMLVFEPITSASSAYLALCYSIFYMSFQAFPIIFQDLYSLSPGICGLTYLPIGAGVVISLPIFWWYDRILLSAQKSHRPWAHREEYRRLPMACLGGPLFALSLFWLGWSARESVSFVVPMLAGIPFGFGFICIFIALLNYLTDAYEIYAASANAASSFTRSLLATVLPLATTPMFEKLGIAGACSLMGGITALMCIIPFIFIWKGDRIRASSKFCIMLKKKKEERPAQFAG